MKDLTIIEGQNEKFVLISKETTKNSLIASYVPLSLYNEGFYNEEDVIDKEVEFQYQITEVCSGWMPNDYDQPNFIKNQINPGDESFDYVFAENEALETANEMIFQHLTNIEHV